jgi:hypothetical protein
MDSPGIYIGQLKSRIELLFRIQDTHPEASEILYEMILISVSMREFLPGISGEIFMFFPNPEKNQSIDRENMGKYNCGIPGYEIRN